MNPRVFRILVLFFVACPVKCLEYGLKWGEKCKIPGPDDYLKPSEECEMSKGLQCQNYKQGRLCGCPISSSLSFDDIAGECRRKPGHHCPYMNSTDPRAYKHLPYNHKCHVNAECMIVDPIPEIEATEKKSSRKKPLERFAICRCKPGYKASRDGLVCHNVNSSQSFTSSLLLLSLLTVFNVTLQRLLSV